MSPMRLLANENFPAKAVDALRAIGHDVVWVKEDFPSTKDADVLAYAVCEARVLLTLDKDFGELAFGAGLPASCGVILFRARPIPELVARLTEQVLRADADFTGRFVVVEEGRVRERQLPRRTERPR